MEKATREALEHGRKALAAKVDQMVSATADLLEPLKDLNESQKAAVATLQLLMQGIMLAKRPAAKLREDILVRFGEQIDSVCPPLGKTVTAGDPCFRATVDYVIALKKCQDKGTDEDECPDAWGAGAAALKCTMDALEKMRGVIRDLFNRVKPPRPFPWPKSAPQGAAE